MSSITIHTIDEELNERLAAEARRRKMSKNALIKHILSEKVGVPVDGIYADDYREFVGLWTGEERAAFEKTQTGNSAVDRNDWET